MTEPRDSKAPREAIIRQLWWRLVAFRIGIIPAPVFLLLSGLIAGFVAADKVPSDILMSIALLSVGGFACAEIGNRIPFLNRIGAAAIFATFVPSYLVYAHLLPESVVEAIKSFTKASNFLYLFIATIVVGAIFGMDRRVLISGFVKIFLPLALGSVVAGLVGIAVGSALGLEPKHTLFFIIIPIMAGGVGEGAIPLSIGYGQILGLEAGGLLAELLPAVMFGSLTAILLSGGLNLLGKHLPHLTGEGRLSPYSVEPDVSQAAHRVAVDAATIAAAGITAVSLYLVGALAQKLMGWPGPVTMLFLAVILKLARAAPPSLEAGAATVYEFFRTAVTYPLLFAIGVSLTPWEKLMAASSPANIATIVATVAALMATGFCTARFIGMYPIDVAIVTACHSGQGGTGDVAILTAANRMQLMPFAQIATRIGGAVTVILALLALAQLR